MTVQNPELRLKKKNFNGTIGTKVKRYITIQFNIIWLYSKIQLIHFKTTGRFLSV